MWDVKANKQQVLEQNCSNIWIHRIKISKNKSPVHILASENNFYFCKPVLSID